MCLWRRVANLFPRVHLSRDSISLKNTRWPSVMPFLYDFWKNLLLTDYIGNTLWGTIFEDFPYYAIAYSSNLTVMGLSASTLKQISNFHYA